MLAAAELEIGAITSIIAINADKETRHTSVQLAPTVGFFLLNHDRPVADFNGLHLAFVAIEFAFCSVLYAVNFSHVGEEPSSVDANKFADQQR